MYDQFVVFQHGDHHVRPNTAKFDGANRPRAASFNVILVFCKVCDVDGLFVCYRLTHKVCRNKVYPQTPARLDQGGRRIMGRQLRQNRFVNAVLAESSLVLFETKAPQPACRVHVGAQLSLEAHQRPGERPCPGTPCRGELRRCA